jgi:hypothetical protein
MYAYDASTLTLLRSGRFGVRDLIKFDLAEGTFGFNSGMGPISWDSISWVGAGKLIAISGKTTSVGTGSTPLTVTLSSIPNTDLTPDVVASVETYTYYRRPVTMYRLYHDPDLRTIISAQQRYRGFIDRLTHKRNTDGTYSISAVCETRSKNHQKRGFRRYSDMDQKQLLATDDFFHISAAIVGQDYFWGRQNPTPPGDRGGAGGRPGEGPRRVNF